jgi:hypothetical protein
MTALDPLICLGHLAHDSGMDMDSYMTMLVELEFEKAMGRPMCAAIGIPLKTEHKEAILAQAFGNDLPTLRAYLILADWQRRAAALN